MTTAKRYRITSESPELDRLEQFYSTVGEAQDWAQEYADDYQVDLEIHEWAYGSWSYVDTVSPS